MTLATCPTDQSLRDYSLGNCQEDASVEIELHLAHCPTCEETICRLDSADDTLTRHLPLAAADSPGPTAVVPSWLDRLRNRDVLQGEARTEPTTSEITDGKPTEGLANYEILGVLGQGGMGFVYLARHKQLNRRVALKVLNPRRMATPDAHRRFQREIFLLGSLNHPGIVMATDAGRVDTGAYLVMELIDGADLSRIVRDGGPLTVGEACEVGKQMAEALAAAHELGTIHRDVKPSNVMIDRQTGRARLLDFGLARLGASMEEAGDTSIGRVLGTLDYMAPEQSQSDAAIDVRADLYSLGATLFFLLTGRPPHGVHAGRSLLEQLRVIAQEEVPLASTLRADIPQELDEFLACLMSHDRELRPASANEVAQQFSRWANGDLAARAADVPSRDMTESEEQAAVEAAQRSLSALLGPHSIAVSGSSFSQTPETAAERGGRRRFWGWLTSLGVLGLAVLAGLVILLKTPNGTLRIESEASDLQINLVDDDEAVHEVQIEQGPKEVLLKAGKYRVRLPGMHDGLTIDQDTITLRKGEQTLLRITKLPAGSEANGVAGTSSNWTPPENPDPNKILQEAGKDRLARRYEDALAKNLWFFQHAVEYQPFQVGVRRSFALHEWVELGRVYPPALKALKNTRYQSEKEVTSDSLTASRREAFADVAAINDALEAPRETAQLFVMLDRDYPKTAEAVFPYAEPALIAVGLYDLCSQYLNPKQRFRQIQLIYESTQKSSQKLQSEILRAESERRFVKETATLVALLVMDQRDDEAQQIIESARKRNDSPELQAAINEARQGRYLAPGVKASTTEPGSAQAEPGEPVFQEAKRDEPEALFQGRPESEWQDQFDRETDPAAKATAAKALLSIASALPPEPQIKRVVEIGTIMLESDRSGVSTDFGLFDDRNAMPGKFTPSGARAIPPLVEVGEEVRTQLRSLPPETVATALAEQVQQGNDVDAAFAYWLLISSRRYTLLSHDDEDARLLLLKQLDVPLTGLDRSAVCLLLRCKNCPLHPSEDVQRELGADLNPLLDLLKDSPTAQPQEKFAYVFLGLVGDIDDVTDGPTFDKRKAAEMVLNGCLAASTDDLHNRVSVPHQFLQMFTLYFNEQVYRADHVSSSRSQTKWFLDGWMSVANHYLRDQWPVSLNQTSSSKEAFPFHLILSNTVATLHWYSDGDDWPVEETATWATQALQDLYAQKSSDPVSAFGWYSEDLLKLLALTTGEIPDFVHAGLPQEVLDANKQYATLKRFVDGEITERPNKLNFEIDSARGLLDLFPYETIKLCLAENQFQPGDHIFIREEAVIPSPVNLAFAASSEFKNWSSNEKRPPLDPVLLLAILNDLTGESEAQDERIATFFSDESHWTRIVLRQHLDDILASQLVVREHVKRLLSEMAAKTKSEELVEAVRTIDPQLVPAKPALESEPRATVK